MGKNLIPLDIRDVSLEKSGDGIKDFSWPLSPEDLKLKLLELYRDLRSLSDYLGCDDSGPGTVLRIMLPYLYSESSRVLHATMLMSGFQRIGRRPTLAHWYPVISEISSDAPGNLSIKIGDDLRNGVRYSRRSLRGLWVRRRQEIEWNGFGLYLSRSYDVRSEIASIQASDLVYRRSKTATRVIRMVERGSWFSDSLARTDFNGGLREEFTDMENSVVELVLAHCPESEKKVSNNARRYLHKWVGEVSAGVLARIENLLSSTDGIPSVLWTGSGASIWSRLLRYVTLVNGGVVEAHDHGASSGQYSSVIIPALTEFDFCSQFNTFTNEQANGFAKSAESNSSTEFWSSPNLSYFDGTFADYQIDVPKRQMGRLGWRRHKRNLKVLYPSIYYRAEQAYPYVVCSDYISMDWHAQLIAFLERSGHEVTIRPHPSSDSVVTNQAIHNMGHWPSPTPFEELIADNDIAIFDSPASTAFRNALFSEIPILLLDNGLLPFTSHARYQLEKRVSIVPTYFNHQNRVEVEWQEVTDGIEASFGLQDNTYIEEYYLGKGQC